MSVVEDVRKAMQDFLAPELRELKARVEALEKRMDEGFNSVQAELDVRFQGLTRHVDSRFDSLQESLALSQRVARLEERETQKGKEQ